MASLKNKCGRNKREFTRRWMNNTFLELQLILFLSALINLVYSNPLPVNVTLQSKLQLSDNKIRVPRNYPGYPTSNGSDYGSSSYPYQYGSQYDYNQGPSGGYPSYPPPSNPPNYSPSNSYNNQYNYPNQYQNQQYHNYPPPSYHYPPPSSGGTHPSSYYSPSSYPSPSSSYSSQSYPSSFSPSSHGSPPAIPFSTSSDEGPVFLGGVFDLKEFSKLSNIPIEELIKMGGTGLKNTPRLKGNKEDDSEEEDDMSETSRRRINQPNAVRRKKKKKKRRKSQNEQLLSNPGSNRRGSEDHDEDYPEKDDEELDYTIDEERDVKQSEKVKKVGEEVEEDDEDDVVLKITRERNKNRSKGSQSSKVKARTKMAMTSTTTVAPIQPYPVMPFPYPFPVPAAGFGTGQSLIAGSASSLASSTQLQSEESQLKPTTVKIGKKPSKHDSEDDDLPVVRPVKENIINVNLPDIFGTDGLFDAIDPNRGDMYSNSHGLSGLTNHRRVSISGFTQGIVKRALKSMVYRIFPSVKGAKKVAAKGCRDVQTIGSMDSILMPLGIAVTLHPLLLPLVPFLLLALGSIKAIESATCFVSEFFK